MNDLGLIIPFTENAIGITEFDRAMRTSTLSVLSMCHRHTL